MLHKDDILVVCNVQQILRSVMFDFSMRNSTQFRGIPDTAVLPLTETAISVFVFMTLRFNAVSTDLGTKLQCQLLF